MEAPWLGLGDAVLEELRTLIVPELKLGVLLVDEDALDALPEEVGLLARLDALLLVEVGAALLLDIEARSLMHP